MGSASVDFLDGFDVPAHKIASACLTDDELLRAIRRTHPAILSNGMSTPAQIRHAVEVLGSGNVVLCHATSTYPAANDELNLRMINTLMAEYPNVPVGYSGHERGLQTTVAAAALGACFLSGTSPWTAPCGARTRPPAGAGRADPAGDVRVTESLGDGVKKVYEGEYAAMRKLRRVAGVVADQVARKA